MNHFSKLKDGRHRTHQLDEGSQTCQLRAVACINILFLAAGVLLIALAVYDKEYIHFVTLPLLKEFLVSGLLIIFLSVLGWIALPRKKQVIVSIYVIVMVFLFVFHLYFLLESLSMKSNYQYILVKRGWSESNEKKHIQMISKCCRQVKSDSLEGWCKNVLPMNFDAAAHCYVVQYSSGVALFFALTLVVAVYATIRYCNPLKESEITEENTVGKEHFNI